MTLEKTLYVRLPRASLDDFEMLNARAQTELRRHFKSDPGQTNDLKSFEAIQSLLEQKAVAAVNCGDEVAFIISESPPAGSLQTCFLSGPFLEDGNDQTELPDEVNLWLNDGNGVVFLSLPFLGGNASKVEVSGDEPVVPLESWRSEAWSGERASAERLEFQIEKILANPRDKSLKLNPSGVPNRVLTNTLKRYVTANPGDAQVNAPVEYRDGSSAPHFPLRALQFSSSIPTDVPVLSFSLLSIRHVELDALVDGSWFRNSQISVSSRSAGLTDALAYEISREQFAKLASKGPFLIKLYQTGLEAPILGFYRALVDLLAESPRAISVLPQHFIGDGNFVPGQIWRCA